jgi:hypothetical protein
MKDYTIAIIDEEAGQRDQFEFVFSKMFNVIQIDTFVTIENLIDQIKSECIDAVAIDYRLTEHHSSFSKNGDFLFKEIRKNLYEFPVFILTRSSDEVKVMCKTIDPSFIIDKDNINFGKGEQNKEVLFLDSIKTKIQVYKTDLNEKVVRLNELEELRRSKSDKFNEYENEFINLNFELGKYITGKSSIPITYFTKESNNKLDSLISKTEALLNKLNENN